MTAFNAAALLTVASAIFVDELTDKDAFLLLTLATRRKALFVLAAGSATSLLVEHSSHSTMFMCTGSLPTVTFTSDVPHPLALSPWSRLNGRFFAMELLIRTT